MFYARIIRNRNRFTGRFAPGCRLIHPDEYWIGPGLGNFRNAAQARKWAIENGYCV